MNIQEACTILEIDTSHNLHLLTQTTLKRQYRKMALKTHPDKHGNTTEATQSFQKVQEAFEVLKRELALEETNSDSDENDESVSDNEYSFVFNSFIRSFMNGDYNEMILGTIQKIVHEYNDITIKMFEGMNRERAMLVYDFIIKYKHILHIDDNVIHRVKDILIEKYNDVNIYILHPTIDDLFDNNVYKLEVNGEKYFVPLWHSEMSFDSKAGEEIIVKCIPKLPDNVISIDENNNLLLNISVSFTFSLFEQSSIPIELGKRRIYLPISSLKIQKNQTVILSKQGISKINEKNLYNENDRADIFVSVTFVE
jgi:curved DNA-binding protein CbpA